MLTNKQDASVPQYGFRTINDKNPEEAKELLRDMNERLNTFKIVLVGDPDYFSNALSGYLE